MIKRKIRRGIRVTRYIVYKETLVDYKEHLWAFIGAFMGIGLIAYLQSNLAPGENLFLIGSFGASSVLIYGAIQSPLAQPRNLVGGHLVSAITGVTVATCVPDIIWITAPLAVASAIVLMQVTKTMHPPGGATALIAVIGSEKIKGLGYMYVLNPVLTGSLVLLTVALLVNNITPNRHYPANNKLKHLFRRSFYKRGPR